MLTLWLSHINFIFDHTTLKIHESDDMTIKSDLYDNELLYLASDLGKRLLPAFETATGIPYGTVNLRHGVPSGETEVASTAGAGSLLLEFEVLSSLLGDVRFGDAAFTAAQSLYSRRSYLGLLGKHIHTGNGQWHESTSGIGSNADSFYEYLLKGHLLFHRQGLYAMFTDTYEAVKRHVQVGDWFTEVDMFSGKSRRNRVENLQAFWPGMESIVGACNSAARLLNSFYAVWQDIGFLPEEFDQALWLNNQVINNSWYPLRPELIESTYLQYRSTGDRSWLTAGARFLDTLEAKTWTKCGYASVSNIGTMQLANSMPSYFLSETCKYLYLLFDDDNFVHDRAYVFSTEAHPFDPMQLPVRSIAPALEDSMMGKEGIPVATHTQTLLSVKCPKTLWWDCGSVAYDADYIKHQQSRRTYTTEEEQAIAEQLAIRQSIISSNSANLASLLRSLYLDAEEISHDLATVKRRENTCYDDQARQQGLPDMPLATQGQTKIASQKVSMDGGVLGLFDVTIYTDGFTVYSREQKDTIEVTNVGESFVFASYISGDPGSLSKTFIGEETGKVVTCSISLVDANGDRIEGDIDRSCSISTFGPTKFPLSPIIADLYIPEESNSRVCKPLRKIQERKATKGSESSWWRHWPSSIMLPSLSNIAQSKVLQDGTVGVIEKSIVDVAGKIVLARRGNCLFEEKTNLAQTAGASAIIIANFEVRSLMRQASLPIHKILNP